MLTSSPSHTVTGTTEALVVTLWQGLTPQSQKEERKEGWREERKGRKELIGRKNGAVMLCLESIFPIVPSCLCRCVVLNDPLKDSSRTQESWNAFLTKLRTLLLMSFTKNLGKFEDDMRTLREKRTEPGWSFCEYFMVQVFD